MASIFEIFILFPEGEGASVRNNHGDPNGELRLLHRRQRIMMFVLLF
jgi:hypothetical protein